MWLPEEFQFQFFSSALREVGLHDGELSPALLQSLEVVVVEVNNSGISNLNRHSVDNNIIK